MQLIKKQKECHMIQKSIEALVSSLTKDERIIAVGLSSHPIPQKPDEGDIDLFIYCSVIPEDRERIALYPEIVKDHEQFQCSIMDDAHWGLADFTHLNGIEAWIMYFMKDKESHNFEDIFNGLVFSRCNGFYPTGRLAMYKNMSILFEREPYLSQFKKRVQTYPPKLKDVIMKSAREELCDEEDLRRGAVRKDLVFFHWVLDNALDAFMQYAYALNDELFPGRKRNLEQVADFSLIPQNISQRVKDMIRLASHEETLQEACTAFFALRDEMIKEKI